MYPNTLFNSHKDLPFLAKWKKVENVEKPVFCIEDKEKCYSHKSFKTSTKTWLKTKRGTQSNSVWSKSMVRTIHWQEYWFKKRSKKWIWEGFL